MKLVIEIPPSEYERIKDIYDRRPPFSPIDVLYHYVADGTPLKDVCSKCWLNTKEGDSDADGD